MFWDNRGFVSPNTQAELDFNTPELKDKNDVNLMKAVTQEHVSMLKRVKKEERERIYQDSLLRDEMHSFGLVPCESTDADIVAFNVTLKTKAGANMWVYKIPIAGGAISSGNWGMSLNVGTTLHFRKCGRWPDGTNSFVTYFDKYKIRADVNTDGEFSFYVGTDGAMFDGSNLVMTTGRTSQEIVLNGAVTCFK